MADSTVFSRFRQERERRRRNRIRIAAVFFISSILFSMILVMRTSEYRAGSNLTESVLKEAAAAREVAAGEEVSDKGTVYEETGSGISYEDPAQDIRRLKDELASYIKKHEGYYGVYFLDLADGAKFGINENTSFIAASTVKIPINLYLYKKIAEGSINRYGTMTYLESDYEEGTGKIRYDAPGGQYTVKELSKLSIEVSDNVAANILLRLLGRSNVKDYMRKLGGRVVDDERNISCPRDMALYLAELYKFCLKNRTLGRELMGYLQNTIYNDRLPALLPDGVKVAHKIGNQAGAYHDVGIVFTEKPYILSVMSKNIKNEKEAIQVIAGISKKVFDFMISYRQKKPA